MCPSPKIQLITIPSIWKLMSYIHFAMFLTMAVSICNISIIDSALVSFAIDFYLYVGLKLKVTYYAGHKP